MGHHHQPAGVSPLHSLSQLPGYKGCQAPRQGEMSRGHSGQAQLSPCPQAIMMSICLQSMVDELMVKKSGGSIRKVRGLPCSTAGWLPVQSRVGSVSAQLGGVLEFAVSICRCCAGGWGAP